MDEQTLIREAVEGNVQAFNQLVLNYQDAVYNLASAILADPTLVEDIVQDTFLQAFRKLSGFRGGSFRAWLFRITVNASYDELRRLQRRPQVPLEQEDENGEELESSAWLVDRGLSVEDQVIYQETQTILRVLLKELPPIFREAVTLVDVLELDYDEAARVIGVPTGTLKSRLARARMRLKESLRMSQAFESLWNTKTERPSSGAFFL